MAPICPLLTGLLLLASPAAQVGETAPQWDAVTEQFDRWDPAAQRQWIGDLLARLDRANRVVLAPGEAARQQTQHAELLRRMAADPAVMHAELLSLLRQTDQREKAAIERLARRFRIQVYETFRARRDEFSRRRAAWDRALAAWESAGSLPQRQHLLVHWLEAAIRASTPGSIAPLPEIPSFEPFAEDAEPLVRPAPERIEPPSPPAVRPEPLMPQPPIPVVPEPHRRTSDLQTPQQPPSGESPLSGRRLPEPVVVVPHEPSERAGVSPRGAVAGSSVAPVRRPVELPLIAEPAAAVDIPPIRSDSADLAAFAAGVGLPRAAGSLPKIAGYPAGEKLPHEGSVSAVPASAVAQRLAAKNTSDAPASRAGQPLSRQVDRPEVFLTKLEPASSEPSGKPPAPFTAGSSARVNLAELAARTAGTNLALQTLEAELDENHGWNSRRLGPLVDRLAFLVMRRNDLQLFHDLVPPDRHVPIGRLESPDAAVSRLAARIVEARAYAGSRRFRGTQLDRRAELQALDELSSLLAEIASP